MGKRGHQEELGDLVSAPRGLVLKTFRKKKFNLNALQRLSFSFQSSVPVYKESRPKPMVTKFSSMLTSSTSEVSWLAFTPIIHFELIFF